MFVIFKRILKFISKNIIGWRIRVVLLRYAGYRIGINTYIGKDILVINESKDKGMVTGSIGFPFKFGSVDSLTFTIHNTLSEKYEIREIYIERAVLMKKHEWSFKVHSYIYQYKLVLGDAVAE